MRDHIKRGIWLTALLMLLMPRSWGGTTSPYVDPNQFLKVPFGDFSPWAQPWRAYLETMPATTFVNGTGLNYQSNANPDLEIHQLALHGIAHIRLEVGWGNIDYTDPTKLDNASTLTPILAACKKYGVRPLILLNANSGAPCPLQMFSRTVAAAANVGDTSIQLTNTSGLVIGYSGLSNLSGYCAAQDLITAINGNTVTLSQPLQVAFATGASVSMATLKYRPFSDPVGDPADYNATLAGWQSYVKVVGSFVANALGSANPNDAGFDMEVWNELTFDSNYLTIDNYVKPITDVYNEGAVWSALTAATAQVAAQNPATFAGVQIGDGFANTIPWSASSMEPVGISAIDKHPYAGRKTFPSPGEPGCTQLNALLLPDATGYQPSYTELFPEYFATDIQTETMVRDMGPLTSSLYGTMHGRDARTPPVTTWVTEVNVAPDSDIPTIDAPTALYVKAKTTARYFCFFLNKGVTLMTLFNDNGGDRDLGLVSDAFLAYAKTLGAVYPADDTGLTSPALAVTGNIANMMKQGLDTTITPATARQLSLLSVSDTHNNTQFTGDGTAAHPDLYDRDVLAFLPFQVNSSRFVVPYYVMTRDVMHVYDATKTEGHQYDMPEEAFTLTVGGLNPLDTVVSYDPIAGTTESVTAARNADGTETLQVEATDSPRLLIIQEKKATPAPTASPVPTGLVATAGNHSVTLTWAAVTGAASYNVYRATHSGGEGTTPYLSGLTSPGAVDNAVTDGTTYDYQVTAVAGTESALSNQVSATPFGLPTVTVAAAANPQNVTGTTTNLSVQGHDPQGQRLSAIWSATGPAPVVFSVNNSMSAAFTMATFTQPGTYSLTVTLTDTSGWSVTSAVTVTVTRTLSSLTVTPSTATVAAGATQKFTASAKDQFGVSLSATSVWTATGGSISAAGVFTAGSVGGQYKVTAAPSSASASVVTSPLVTRAGLSGSALVTIPTNRATPTKTPLKPIRRVTVGGGADAGGSVSSSGGGLTPTLPIHRRIGFDLAAD